jgi:hypothetical protein
MLSEREKIEKVRAAWVGQYVWSSQPPEWSDLAELALIAVRALHGNLTLTDADPIPHVTVIKTGQTVDGLRYVSHFVTCHHAAQHRRKR